MTFRDDHEAALARAEALERELAREREKVDAQAAKLERAARDRKRIEAELARHRAECGRPEVPAPPKPKPKPATGARRDPEESNAGPVVVGGLLLLAATLLIAAGFVKQRRQQERWTSAPQTRVPPPEPTCTLDTIPSGAVVYATEHDDVGSNAPRVVGTTPITKTASEWVVEGALGKLTYEARLPGYPRIQVFSPVAGLGCRATPFRFPIEAPAP